MKIVHLTGISAIGIGKPKREMKFGNGVIFYKTIASLPRKKNGIGKMMLFE